MAKRTPPGPLGSLMEYLVQRLFTNQPSPDRCVLAKQVLIDGLIRNAPNVVASLTLGPPLLNAVPGHLEILDGTISPSGKIALLTRNRTNKYCLLITWEPDHGFRILEVKEDTSEITKGFKPSVFFPEGSDEPAVILGHQMVCWSGLPKGYKVRSTKAGKLSLWKDREFRLRVASVDSGPVVRMLTKTGTGFDIKRDEYHQDCEVVWIGKVEDHLVTVTRHQVSEGVSRDTVHWKSGTVFLPNGRLVIPESIGCRSNELHFAERDQTTGCAFVPSHVRSACVAGGIEVPKNAMLRFHDGRIFLVSDERHDHVDGVAVSEFRSGRFVTFGKILGEDLAVDELIRVIPVGDSVVVTGRDKDDGDGRIISVLNPDGIPEQRVIQGIHDVRGFHNGYAYREGESFTWHQVGGDRKYATFPTYGLPFERFVAVEDVYGKAIMAWVFTEGTLIILRYPLPR